MVSVDEGQFHKAVGATYIQSPNRKLVFGFGGLLDSANAPDSCCMGTARSESGESIDGGGKVMTGEFISREGFSCNGRTLEIMNSGPRANVCAPAAARGEWPVAWKTVPSRRRERGRSQCWKWWLENKELHTPRNFGKP